MIVGSLKEGTMGREEALIITQGFLVLGDFHLRLYLFCFHTPSMSHSTIL